MAIPETTENNAGDGIDGGTPTAEPDVLEELKRRCAAASIKIDEQTSDGGIIVFYVLLPSGRSVRSIPIARSARAKELLSIPFERLTPLGRYVAFLDREEAVIEAAVQTLGRHGDYAIHKLLGLSDTEHDTSQADVARFELVSETGAHTVRIGWSSATLRALHQGRFLVRRSLSIFVCGSPIKQHDAAVEFLERIADSVFFEIDLLSGIALGLVRYPTLRQPRGGSLEVRNDLRFPRFAYEHEPMSLYLYPRRALGIPLLQYLAFYQSIEFYFPIYSQKTALRRLRNFLMSPSVNANRDADLGRLVAAVRTGGGRGLGDEKTQLRATLQECLDEDELKAFFHDEERRMEFFSRRAKTLGLDGIQVDGKDDDLRVNVANRIYNIRCKIVHTKSGGDGDVDLLLPFSEESETLGLDIELIQHVARQVLIAASRPLHINPT